MTSASVDRTWTFFAGAASNADEEMVLEEVAIVVVIVEVKAFGCWARKALVPINDQLPRRQRSWKADRTMVMIEIRVIEGAARPPTVRDLLNER